MTLFYSPSENGFYDSDINRDMPSDVIAITRDEYVNLFNGQANGQVIVANKKGKLSLKDSSKDK